MSRSRKARPAKLAIAACLLLAAGPWAPIALIYTSEWLQVDRCLDSGGSFNYRAMKCDYTTNHPYVAFSRRHVRLVLVIPHLIVISAIAIVAAIVLLLARSVGTRRLTLV